MLTAELQHGGFCGSSSTCNLGVDPGCGTKVGPGFTSLYTLGEGSDGHTAEATAAADT